jgi:phospholipase C
MSLENIEHVVVLMLENRSFDSMLGWLYEHDAPALNIPAAKPGDEYRGLQKVDLDKFLNTALNGTVTAKPTRGVQGFSVPDVAPGEEFNHVNTQFYDTPTPAPDAPITMTGVLADFVEVLQGLGFKDADLARLGPMMLQTFTPGQLPVLSQLARHYAVSDAWFASVPSQTNPNRAFLTCATSNGMVNNGDLETNPQAKEIEAVLGMAIGDDRVDAPTIFNALSDAGVDWAVFFQTSYLPQKISTLLTGLPILIPLLGVAGFPLLAAAAEALLLALSPYTKYLEELTSGELGSCYTWRLFPQIQKGIPDAAQHFGKLEDFHRLARAGQLPRFTYIEPFWSISHTTNDNPIQEKLVTVLGNDYHPPSNILVGEQFVKEVYTSLIANSDAWRKTLLLITFDEFVGSFDHVTDPLKPGTVAPPWGPHGQPPFTSPTHFAFDRLGARVPTIVVSPYVQKGTVFRSTGSVPYDHTSVIATTLKWLGHGDKLASFGDRAQAAPTFEGVLTLDRPRTDETALPFLDTPRAVGDLVQYGDSFLLRNQSGQYLTTYYATMKAAGGGSIVGDSVIGICIDLDIAAYFPRIGGEQPAVLSFVTQAPDPAAQIDNNDQVLIVSRELGLGPRNLLGAWADSHDCYYSDEYLDGDNAVKQRWAIQKLADTDQPVRYGDRVFLVNAHYKGARLTRDERWVVGKGWLTTDPKGDYWTIEPAPARVAIGVTTETDPPA